VFAEGPSGDWYRPPGVDAVDLTITCEGNARKARVARSDRGARVVFAEGAVELELLSLDDGCLRYRAGPLQKRMLYLREGDALHLSQDGNVFVFREPSASSAEDAEADPHRVRAPIAGVVCRVAVAPGEPVRKGDVLLWIEAMKMETRVNAGVDARVAQIHCRPGEAVDAGALLLELAPTLEDA
jgi:3-methylcrotonyl-CoA carboxylase alpha subunit